jgi:large subunit ribosomal protein L40e
MISKIPSQQLESQANFEPFQIFIKTLTGSILVVSTDAQCKIGDIMSIIQSREGIRIEAQRLIFAGKQLLKNFSLADYGIQSDSTLHLLLRLYGGEEWVDIIVYIAIIIFGIPIFAKLKQLIMQQVAMLTATEDWEDEGEDLEQ